MAAVQGNGESNRDAGDIWAPARLVIEPRLSPGSLGVIGGLFSTTEEFVLSESRIFVERLDRMAEHKIRCQDVHLAAAASRYRQQQQQQESPTTPAARTAAVPAPHSQPRPQNPKPNDRSAVGDHETSSSAAAPNQVASAGLASEMSHGGMASRSTEDDAANEGHIIRAPCGCRITNSAGALLGSKANPLVHDSKPVDRENGGNAAISASNNSRDGASPASSIPLVAGEEILEGDEEEESDCDEVLSEDEFTFSQEYRYREARRIFMMVSSKIFEQRLIKVYRELLARQKQTALLEEEAAEEEAQRLRQEKKMKQRRDRRNRVKKQRASTRTSS